MDKTEQFVNKSRSKFKDKFSYEKTVWKTARDKLTITCKEHGDFDIIPASHLRATGGCLVCKNENAGSTQRLDFASKSKKRYGDTFSYEECVYKNNHTPVKLKCGRCGRFFECSPHYHLTAGAGGCKNCGGAAGALKRVKQPYWRGVRPPRVTEAQFVESLSLPKHIAYKQGTYKGISKLAVFNCSTHGEFTVTASCIQRSKNFCRKCYYDNKGSNFTQEQWVRKFIQVHGDLYGYEGTGFIPGNKSKISITCKQHGDFTQTVMNHAAGRGCPACGMEKTLSVNRSVGELEVYAFVKALVKDCKSSDRTVLGFGRELDIFVKSKNLAIEYNGLYWHSDFMGKPKEYHREKTEECSSKGVRLLHIREDLWNDKKEQIKNVIKHCLVGATYKEYARKTVCKEVSQEDAKIFIDKYHVQGWSKAETCLGLFVNGELISLTTFSTKRGYLFKTEGTAELVRLCSLPGCSVVGGLAKMLKHYVKENKQLSQVKTYCDLNLFTGKVYENSGFVKVGQPVLGYVYFKGKRVYSRYSFQKHKLPELLDVFDKTLSEKDNMANNGYARIYNAGVTTYIHKIVRIHNG